MIFSSFSLESLIFKPKYLVTQADLFKFCWTACGIVKFSAAVLVTYWPTYLMQKAILNYTGFSKHFLV